MAHARANTLEAFVRALALGATGLESDVWLTVDGAAVLDHDGRIRRGLRRRRAVRELTRSQLPSHIPTLGDLYEACGTDFELALDVGDPEAVPSVLETAAGWGAGAVTRLWLCSGSVLRLGAWRELDRRIQTVHSRGSWRPRSQQELDESLGALAQAGVRALNLRARHCTEAIAAGCRDHGLELLAWGVRSRTEAGRVLSLGAVGIMGDDVRALRGALTPPPPRA